MQSKVDMGLALLEMQNWQKISVHDDFMIVSDKKGLEKTFHCYVKSNFLEILDPSSQSMLQDMVSNALTDHVGSSIIFTMDGTPLEVLLTRCEDKLDIFFRNIEDRLLTLEHLTIFSRQFLTSPAAIFFTDMDANIISANRAFLDLYGYSLDEVVGKNPRILKSGRQSPTVYGEIWANITDLSCGNWSGELINRRKDGEERTAHSTISAVRRSNGCLVGYIATSIDISREKRLEESLKTRNEELVLLDNLNSGLLEITSSELKAPLNSIISRASLIKETIDVSSRDKLLDQVEKIISDCSRIRTVVSDFFDVGKIESGNTRLSTTRVRLDSLLRTCIDVNAASALKKEIRISLDMQAAPEPVLVEIVKMERVFNNLIVNAVKFSPAGSTVSVIYRDCPEGKLVEIQDQGPGIPDEDLDGIFDRFFQVRKKGAIPKRASGVGLSLNAARIIVESHGGKIKAANLPSGGCMFSVLIPADRPIVSGRDVAALIHDPSGRIFSYLESPLRAEEVCCFITKTDFEARRIFEHEKPDLAFVGSDAITPELRSMLMAGLEGNAYRTELILIAHEEPAGPDNLFSRVLLMPVNDLDLLEILKDIRAKPFTPGAEKSRYSVAIMDSDETTHEVLGEYLQGAGYEIRHAYHPDEALKLLAASRPDLILLDLQMPEMNGFQMFKTIKSNLLLRNAPVIFLNSDGPDGNAKEAGIRGANYITKPFSKSEVLARIKATLNRSARTQKMEKALEGNLADVSLPELLQALETGHKSANVRLDDIDGEIFIDEGMFVTARQGVFHGEEAFLRLFFLGKGAFSVQFIDHLPEHSETAVPVQMLVMSGAVYLDEVRHLLNAFPFEGTVLDLAEGAELPSELAGIFLPCSLQELLVLMKGSLKQNAELIGTAFRTGLLKQSSSVDPVRL